MVDPKILIAAAATVIAFLVLVFVALFSQSFSITR